MVLPVAMLAIFNTATLTLLMRSSLVDVLRQDYITAARASGLPERRVVMGHALRNAFIPVLTYLGILFGLMLGTAPVTETVFTWPGLGRALHRGDPAARLSGDHGRDDGDHRHAGRGDAADGCGVCAARSADPAGMRYAGASITVAAVGRAGAAARGLAAELAPVPAQPGAAARAVPGGAGRADGAAVPGARAV